MKYRQQPGFTSDTAKSGRAAPHQSLSDSGTITMEVFPGPGSVDAYHVEHGRNKFIWECPVSVFQL